MERPDPTRPDASRPEASGVAYEHAGIGSASGARAWMAPGFRTGATAEAVPDALLARLFSLEPAAWLRRIPGRETFSWPGEARVVKRFVGGDTRDYWFERLAGRAVRSPARREAENLLALAAEGFAVPRALAWVEESAAAGHPRRAGRSVLVMERVEYEATVRERLADRALDERGRERLFEHVLALVVRLHAREWIHRDLYAQHVVCRADGSLALLDVGRARRCADATPKLGSRWFVKDLAALRFSTAGRVSNGTALRFLDRWLEAVGRYEGADARERARTRRRWAKRVLAKARRYARHRPRYVDPHDPVDVEDWGGDA